MSRIPLAQALGGRRSALLWSLVALACGVGLSIAVAVWHRGSIRDAQAAELRQTAQRSFDALEQQVRNCMLLVRAVQTLFLASDSVTPDEFARIYDNLDPRRLFPSLVAFAYAERRTDGDGGAQPHYVTTMAAPAAGNERLIGLDVSQQPPNLRAVELSRDSNEPVMSASFRLVQLQGQASRPDGVVIRLPVYASGPIPSDVAERRARHAGSLAVSFRVETLIASAFSPEARRRFDIDVVDVTDGGEAVLYGDGVVHDGGFEPLVYRLDAGGRRWELRLSPRPGVAAAAWPPTLTLASGLATSLLLMALVWSMVGTRARAIHMAARLSAQYRDSEARFRTLNELLPALVVLVRAGDLVPVYANQAARRRLPMREDAIGGDMAVAFGDEELVRRLHEVARTGTALDSYPLQLRGEDGRMFWTTLSVSPIELGGQPHLLAVANDITELRELNDQLSYQASHDALTDLFNRREFERRLEQAISRVDDGGPGSALLYVDLDQFKLINDTCGHYAGDQLLAQLAIVLHRGLRPEDVIARLGGDEFGILLVDVDPDQAMHAAERIRSEVDGFVYTWEQKQFTLTTSIGIVMIDRFGLSRRELLSLADTACYMAKERGRNRAHLFSENDLETARRRTEMEWVNRLRRALSEGRFELDYQEIEPLKPPRQRDVGVHVELLVRLRDEDGQRVPPGAFIPAAERFGVMPQIDRWVVETALANFNRLHPSGERLAQCAINLSVNTVEDEEFAEYVLAALERFGVPAHKVCFEITETAAVGNMTRVVRFMQQLRAVGCRFALDDFGAGMASFGYLKDLPVDILKIDGSFIRNIETDAVNYSIVRAVTDIGHQVGLEVIAEWVANERSRELLRGLGVDFVQGFAVHQPQPAVIFLASAE